MLVKIRAPGGSGQFAAGLESQSFSAIPADSHTAVLAQSLVTSESQN